MPAPYQPFVPTSGKAQSFDLRAMSKELVAQDAYVNSGRISRTLARSDHMTTVLVVMNKDAEMHDHTAPGPATVTVISGSLDFTFEDIDEVIHLQDGASVIFAKNTVHRVKAVEASSFLLLIGGTEK